MSARCISFILPAAAWEAKRAKLETEYAALNTQYRPLADEVKKLWKIKYAVESARHEMEREQDPAHEYEQER